MYNYNSDYSYGYSHNTEADTIAGMSIIFFLFFALVAAIIGYVISSLLYMLIFKKSWNRHQKSLDSFLQSMDILRTWWTRRLEISSKFHSLCWNNYLICF